jgi:hypothetical protein
MYRTEPPTDKTIREWYMKFQQSGCLCAAKRRGRPGPSAIGLSAVSFLVVAQSSSEVPEGLMNNLVFTLHFVTDNGPVIICYINIAVGKSIVK